MREIRLYGELGRRFGRRFSFDVATPAEAIRALSAVVPGFREHFAKRAQAGAKYHVFVGKRDIGEQELTHPAGDVIRIAPEIAGAKRGGLFQTILGAVLMVVSVVGIAVTGNPAFLHLADIGFALAVGGVVQMLAPQPKLGDMNGAERPENRPSYSFNGPVNTMAQGHPVPILYGELMVGSAVISAGMIAEDF